MVKEDRGFDVEVLERLPLAEGVLAVMRYALETDALNQLYERERGRCYENVLSFADFVRLMGDALLGTTRSARESLLAAAEQQTLPVTPRAFYGKLARIPVNVSSRFLLESSNRVRDALPAHSGELPPSLAEFAVTVLDGKVVKHVPRRLLPLRYSQPNAKKLLGGRALAAIDLRTGLVVACHCHPDGESNDIRFVPELLQSLQGRLNRPLFVGDRAFGTVEQAQRFLQQGQFLLRQHGQTPFVADAQTPVRDGQDRFGRAYREEWGWICRGKKRAETIRVRRLTVQRDQEPLVLITSLEDADRYPAGDLLEIYLRRWQIEQVFQEITSVFQLRQLIGTTPEATLFQLTFCLLVYNIIRVVKHYVAQAGQKPLERVSSDLLFRDVRKQLTAACELIEPSRLAELTPKLSTPAELQKHLQRLLGVCWKNKWQKANQQLRDPTRTAQPKPKKLIQTKVHDSVYRILQKSS
jgi:hypothetical protein